MSNGPTKCTEFSASTPEILNTPPEGLIFPVYTLPTESVFVHCLEGAEGKDGSFAFEFRTVPIGGGGEDYTRTGGMWSVMNKGPRFVFSERLRMSPNGDVLQARLLEAQKMEAIGTLTGGIAHDYNNLMTVIMGNLSIAREGVEKGSFTAHCIDEAERASGKVRDLTHELMSLSLGGGAVKEVGSLTALLKEASRLIPEDGGFSLKESISEDLWPVSYDHQKMGAVFKNVVTNAVEAMPDGGTIEIGAENLTIARESQDPDPPLKPGDYVRVSIRDHGVGIPEERMEKIFDPYFSTKSMGVQKGMGLGLSTAYAIVQKHGGHVAINSSHGVGDRGEHLSSG